MDGILELIGFFQILISAAGTARIIGCFISSILNPDEAHGYKTKIKNILGFIILSVIVLELIELGNTYFPVP